MEKYEDIVWFRPPALEKSQFNQFANSVMNTANAFGFTVQQHNNNEMIANSIKYIKFPISSFELNRIFHINKNTLIYQNNIVKEFFTPKNKLSKLLSQMAIYYLKIYFPSKVIILEKYPFFWEETLNKIKSCNKNLELNNNVFSKIEPNLQENILETIRKINKNTSFFKVVDISPPKNYTENIIELISDISPYQYRIIIGKVARRELLKHSVSLCCERINYGLKERRISRYNDMSINCTEIILQTSIPLQPNETSACFDFNDYGENNPLVDINQYREINDLFQAHLLRSVKETTPAGLCRKKYDNKEKIDNLLTYKNFESNTMLEDFLSRYFIYYYVFEVRQLYSTTPDNLENRLGTSIKIKDLLNNYMFGSSW